MTSFCNEIKYDLNINFILIFYYKNQPHILKISFFLFVSNQLRDQGCVLCFSEEKLLENKHLQAKVVGKGSVLSYIYTYSMNFDKTNLYISTVSALN